MVCVSALIFEVRNLLTELHRQGPFAIRMVPWRDLPDNHKHRVTFSGYLAEQCEFNPIFLYFKLFYSLYSSASFNVCDFFPLITTTRNRIPVTQIISMIVAIAVVIYTAHEKMYVLQKYGHVSRNHVGDVSKPYDNSYHCGLWTTVRDVIAICIRIRKASENVFLKSVPSVN